MSEITVKTHRSKQERQNLIDEIKSEVLNDQFHSVHRTDIADVLDDKELACFILHKAPELLWNFPQSVKENKTLLLEVAKTIGFSYHDQKNNAFISAIPATVKNDKDFVLPLLMANPSAYSQIFRPYFEATKSMATSQGIDSLREVALAYVGYVRNEKMTRGIVIDISTFAGEFPLTLKQDKQFILETLKQLPEAYKMIPSQVKFKESSLFNDLDIIKEILSIDVHTPIAITSRSKKASYVLSYMWKDCLEDEKIITFLLEACPTDLAYCKWVAINRDSRIIETFTKNKEPSFYSKALTSMDETEGLTNDVAPLPRQLADIIFENCPLSVLKNIELKTEKLMEMSNFYISKKEIEAISKPKVKTVSKRRLLNG